jgi:uncharacterized protein (TIGR02757 family)
MPVKKQNMFTFLEGIYDYYNNSRYIVTDPVMFLHTQKDDHSRELTGLFSATLAYGRVAQILKSIRKVIQCVSLSPGCLAAMDNRKINSLFADFKHRFTTGKEIVSLLYGCKKMYEIHGSLHTAFLSHYNKSHVTFIPALTGFIKELKSLGRIKKSSLLPDPEKKSACKRLHLFLRWMVRKDEIDPGPWQGLPASKLIVPLDTHMYRIAVNYGFTRRNQADIKAAIEITREFAKINPGDPVKYDFALTRIGMTGGRMKNKQIPDYST